VVTDRSRPARVCDVNGLLAYEVSAEARGCGAAHGASETRWLVARHVGAQMTVGITTLGITFSFSRTKAAVERRHADT